MRDLHEVLAGEREPEGVGEGGDLRGTKVGHALVIPESGRASNDYGARSRRAAPVADVSAVAVVSAASAMGILVPPCILMIVIGSVASLSVAALFTAGFLPAVVLAIAVMVYIWWVAGRTGIEPAARPSLRGLAAAFREALIPLGMPAIIFGGILGGIMTPTEASVVAVLYAALVGLFVYREIAWLDLPRIIIGACMVTGAVGLLLATAGVVSWFLTVQQMPAALIACGIAGLTVDEATRAMLPFVGVLCVGRAMIVLVPWFTLVLPRLLNLL